MSETHTVHLDRPIQYVKDDKLGREGFARSIAEQIQYSPTNDSYVTAVVGPWGCGKTSILNMVEEILGESDKSALFLRFNPWLFTRHEQLLAHFFQEIAAELREQKGQELRAIWRGFEAYSRFLKPLRVVSEGRGGPGEDERGEAASLNQRRRILERALREAKHRLVVVIDDIDRLEDGEIRDVMRLVRLVGDFPNMVYVLSYDRERVEEALGEAGRGKAYLDKIVQIEHRVPKPRATDLSDILIASLNEALNGVAPNEVNQNRLMTMIQPHIAPLFRGLREIYRYVNALRPTVRRVGAEVALSDLLGLEAIRILFPAIFEGIAKNADLFYPPDVGYNHNMAQDEGIRKFITSLFDMAGDQKVNIEGLLKELFPKIQRLFGGAHFMNTWAGTWRKQGLVAHPDVLEIYLSNALPKGMLPSPEVRSVFAMLGDEKALQEKLSEMSPEQLEHLLDRLVDFENDFRPETVSTAVKVLYNQWPRLREGTEHIFPGAEITLSTVVLCLLRRVEKSQMKELADVLIKQIQSLSAKEELISILKGDKLLVGPDVENLNQSLVGEVLAASDDELASECKLADLLFREAMALEPARSEDRIRQLSSHDLALSRLLTSGLFEERSDASDGIISSVEYRLIFWDDMERVLGSETLAERIRAIDVKRKELSLDERQTLALDTALKYLRGWRPSDRIQRLLSAQSNEPAESECEVSEGEGGEDPSP